MSYVYISLGDRVRFLFLKIKKSLGRVCWFIFVILVFWEVKEVGLFEVRSSRLVWLIW